MCYCKKKTKNNLGLKKKKVNMYATKFIFFSIGNEIEKCFNGNNNIDATRLYDDCITEICHLCNQNDYNLWDTKNVTQLFKNTCQKNNVQINM